ncbi:MAG TPA: hypothetical protein VIN73_08855 [Vicingaceae bacterium]
MEIVNWKGGLDGMLSCKLKHNSAVHTWGVDPLAHEFSSWSPYVAFADNPLFYIDPDGRAVKPVNEDANLLISASFGSFGVSMEQFASALQISTRNGVIRSNLISSSSGMALDMRGFKKHLKNEGITLNGEQLKDAYNLYSKLQSGDLYEIAVFIKPISAPRIDGGNGQSGTVLVDGVNNSTNVAFGEFSQQFENNPDVIDDKTNEQGYGVLQYKPENPNDPDLSHKGTIIIDATKSSTPSKATETLNKALEDTP